MKKYNIICTVKHIDNSISEHITESWATKKQAQANVRLYTAIAATEEIQHNMARHNIISMSYRVEKA